MSLDRGANGRLDQKARHGVGSVDTANGFRIYLIGLNMDYEIDRNT